MPTKKKGSKEGAIVKRADPAPLVLAGHGELTSGLRSLAEAMSGTLAPKLTGQVMHTLRWVSTTVEAMEKQAKERIVALLKEQGERVSDKGSRKLVVEGWVFEMSPYRTGTDPRKLEALLRAKSLPVEKYMDTKVTYEVNEEKCRALLQNGRLTPDELDTCAYSESWTVRTPKENVDD